MPVMDAVNRMRTFAQAMREWPGQFAGITKPDLLAAVNATDDWIEANQSSYNTALPQPFRANATLAQKTFLFCFVAMRRASRLRSEED